MANPPTAADFQALQDEVVGLRARAGQHPAVHAPARFNGDPATVAVFAGQCEMFLELRAAEFTTDRARMGFIYNLLEGHVAAWATSLIRAAAPQVATAAAFLEHIRETWGSPVNTELAERRLDRLNQREMSLAQYISTFRVLASQVQWNDAAIRYQFLRGLSGDLQQEILRVGDRPATLEALITTSLRVDAGVLTRRQWSGPAPRREQAAARSLPRALQPAPAMDEPEPMQLGHVRPKVDAAEKARRQRLNLCWYCGGSGHFSRECPQKPRRPQPRAAAAWEEAAPAEEPPQPAGEEFDRV